MRNTFSGFLLPIILLMPTVALKWQDQQQGLRVTLDQGDEHISQCIQGGLEVRYRLELKSCHRQRGWFKRCGEAQLLTRNIEFDPVSETYQITSDLISDAQPPSKVVVDDPDQAEMRMRDYSIDSIEKVLKMTPEELKSPERYLSVRVRGYCQQDDQSLVAQIPYHLTFGMFQFAGFDTGWIDYDLAGR